MIKSHRKNVILLFMVISLSLGWGIIANAHGHQGHHGLTADRAFDVNGNAREGFGPGIRRGEWEETEQGRCFRYHDGSYAIDQWEMIDGNWYCFDENGYCRSECIAEKDGDLYWLDNRGHMLFSRELCVDGTAYIAGSDGRLVKASEVSEYDSFASEQARLIVSELINEDMDEAEKIEAIFDYVRSNMEYTVSGPLEDCAYGAAYGLRRRSGNCFEYAAVSHYLLMAAGFDDIIVSRESDNNHFWNLVRTNEGWKHFDTTPWEQVERICMADTELLEEKYWDTHNFDKSAYPLT